MKLPRNSIYIITMLLFLACKPDYFPKPRGYYRIDLPEKEYTAFKADCPFTFEYPEYTSIQVVNDPSLCWYNLAFPAYNAKIHLTYKPIYTQDDLIQFTEDIRKIVYKHTIKADAIKENLYTDPTRELYGILYDIKGNTASQVNFFVTDSTNHFLSGALYFNTSPNYDSLAPVIQFFREDIVHLIETLAWEH